MRLLSLSLAACLGAGTAVAAPLTPEQICRRLVISEEVFVMNPDGTRAEHKVGQYRLYRHGIAIPNKNAKDGIACTLQGGGTDSSSDFDGPLHMNHKWTVHDDGRIEATVTQYAKRLPRDQGLADVLKTKTVTVKDMAPIIWVSPAHKHQRVVVRLSPDLSDNDEAKDLTRLPLTGTDIVVTDSRGRLWGQNINTAAPYVSMTLSEGTLLLSYYSFKGAHKLGEARGHEIDLDLGDGLRVTLVSKTPLLPTGVSANVYGSYDPGRKSSGINSVSLRTTDTEANFLKRIKQH